ncbi:hypothetical protein C1645_830102 [Glomus cerebriforme]|uniref:Uncharacterized protein n=1 Tax=Glomus cerebriforme TaxID=658196 RepID=A0A397SPE9_9GLOM|nr:hypothetical protein C1645_830102 [Glomus cerebriforme]
MQVLPNINPVSYSLPQVIPVSQSAFTKDDMQKAIQEVLSQQKTELRKELAKEKAEFQSQMAQQMQVSASQTVELIRQPRGPPSSLKIEENLKNYYVAEYLKKLGILNKEDLDSDYPVKPFQRSCPQRSNVSKLNIRKCDICEETGHSSNNEGDGYDEENNIQPEIYDELLPKLSPAMYQRSEFDGINLATAKILGWKVNKSSKFAIKGNSKHISEALRWYTDVAVTLKDKKNKPIVTIIGNYACIDNSKPKPMLWLETIGIQKVKGISDSAKNQFCIEDHRKIYTILTFSKIPEINDLSKEEQNQVTTDFPSLTSEKNLKKSAKSLKSAL